MAEVDSPAGPRDWTFQDRDDFTAAWNRANVLNLMRGADGSQEYQSIRQRMAFYDWFDQIREVQKQDILWPAAAWIVASQMASLENPVRTLGMTVRRAFTLDFRTSAKLIMFGKAGNKAIFDNVFPKLKAVFERGIKGRPLVGTEATEWDAATLHAEQFDVVQPVYVQFAAGDQDIKDELKSLASGHDIFAMGGVAINFSLDFKGDILNPVDRYNHGIVVVTGFYKKFKLAIDEDRRTSQAVKADPTAGGMLRAG